MNNDCLKLTTYFGERHRTDDQFVADAGLTPDWSRLSGPTASKINGKAFQLWELPAAKTDNGL